MTLFGRTCDFNLDEGNFCMMINRENGIIIAKCYDIYFGNLYDRILVRYSVSDLHYYFRASASGSHSPC